LGVKVKLLLAGLIVFLMCLSAQADDYTQVPAAIDIHSCVSDGRYTIPEIIEIARAGGIKALILSDNYLARWEYGQWPLRNILKKRVEYASVSRFGISRYLDQLKALAQENPDMLLVPAVTVGPYYYWQGSVFGGKLRLLDWHKHMLVAGLEGARDYQLFPVVGNERGLRRPIGISSIFLLWPVLLVFMGFLSLRYAAILRRRLYQTRIKVYSVGGILFIVLGFIALANNFPFQALRFDQYRGSLGSMPYQNLIDYVDKRGGLIFWDHPETGNVEQIGPVRIGTDSHEDDLLLTHDYTGFAVFPEGYSRVARPGGIWDQALKEYCLGKRRSPVWAIAEVGYKFDGSLKDALANQRTVLLVRKITDIEALEALRKGRAYCMESGGSASFVLDDFSVSSASGQGKAISGEELAIKGNAVIHVKGRYSDARKQHFKINIIRDGVVIKAADADAPLDISFEDSSGVLAKSYYRLEAVSGDLRLVTNPIFIVPERK
jgi:hypothetical protein